jgi:hypothetical protein
MVDIPGTSIQPPSPPSAALTVGNLVLAGSPTADEIGLAWTATPGATSYHLQMRPHDSDRDWETVPGTFTKPSGEVKNLRASTDYDLRVSAVDKDDHEGPPSVLWRQRTATRVPRWSDLVTDTARGPDIDVTRVQMLLFTGVSAFFVALKILQSSTIPEIPDTYVTLMGISNGVYLTSKYVSR